MEYHPHHALVGGIVRSLHGLSAIHTAVAAHYVDWRHFVPQRCGVATADGVESM